MKILCVVDAFNREYIGLRCLQEELRKLGHSVSIVSRLMVDLAYDVLEPDCMILPKLHKVPGLEHIAQRCAVVLTLAEGFLNESAFLQTREIMDSSLADLVCCWGEFDKKTWADHGIFNPNILHVTGHHITDHWYLPQKKRQKKEFLFGLTTSIRAMTHKANGAKTNFVDTVAQIELSGRNSYFIDDEHAESWVAFGACFIRSFVSLLAANRDIDFSLRPHPLECPECYAPLTKRFPNVRMARDPSIVTWLSEIDVLASTFSSSMIDAFVRGVKVFSLRRIFSPWVLEHIPASLISKFEMLFPAPGSLEELRHTLNAPYSPMPELNELLRLHYNYPDRMRPSQNIARLVDRLGPKILRRKKTFSPIHSKFKRHLPCYLAWRSLLQDMKNLHAEPSLRDLYYFPHHFRRNAAYNEVARAILDSKFSGSLQF